MDLDESRGVLVIDESFEIDIERVVTRVPSGAIVRGPVLAKCPRGCGERARVLWVDASDPEMFLACRACVGVTYATAQTSSEAERARLAYARLRQRLGLLKPWQTFEPKPFQRRRAYARLAERLERARERVQAAPPPWPRWARKKVGPARDR